MAERSRVEISRLRAAAYPVLSSVYLLLIFGLPLMCCVAFWRETPVRGQFFVPLGYPVVFAIVFTLVAGLLSIPHQKGIIAGRFPRDVGHRVYFHRRLYGLCWTCLFYFKPIYFLILAIDPLRKGTFRLFGYRGSLDFTIYPDTWIRDLPLLTFGDKAYIANRSTLGSNICLQTGQILVGPISIGDRSIVGHLGVIGLGSSIDEDSELGVGVATGIQVSIGRNTKVGAISGLNHGSSVGNDCDIGAMSYVGSGTRVLDGVRLPGGSISPDYSVIDRRTPDREDGEIFGPVPGLGEPTPLSVRPDTATSAYVEHHYRACVYVKEICVLFPSAQLGSEVSQGLHAVVVPDLDLARTRNVVNVSEKIRFDFATLSGKLPDTLKISTYDFWSGCLPRTSVGDIDRDAIKNSIRSTSGQIASSPTFQRELSDEDKAWIDRPEVRRVLDVLRAETKSPKSTYHPDDTLEFDLGFNSLGRVELLFALENLGVKSDSQAVVDAYTIRELVDRVVKEKGESPSDAPRWQSVFESRPSAEEIKFFEASRTFSAPFWFAIGRGIELIGRVLFDLQVSGRENLPKSGPFIICPNHQSYLDPPFVLSVLPWNVYKRLFLVGTSELFGTGMLRALARTLRLYPIDPDLNLIPAMRVLAYGLGRGMGLLLYPEGERSIDGEPKCFKKGAGLLSAHLGIPIYPLAIDGFSEAWPRGKRFARFARLKMKFGQAVVCPTNVELHLADEVVTQRVRDSIAEMWLELRTSEGGHPSHGKADHRLPTLK